MLDVFAAFLFKVFVQRHGDGIDSIEDKNSVHGVLFVARGLQLEIRFVGLFGSGNRDGY